MKMINNRIGKDGRGFGGGRGDVGSVKGKSAGMMAGCGEGMVMGG